MRARIPLHTAILGGLLLFALAGCSGATDHSSKPSSDTNKTSETLPKAPKPDPG